MKWFTIVALVSLMAASVGFAQCPTDETNVSGGLGISRVQIGTLDVNHGAPTTHYSDYTGSYPAPKLPIASSDDVIVFASTGFTVAIWFDWDKDNVFSQSEKLAEVVSTDSNSATVLSYYVPSHAITGNVRMRIRAIQGVTNVDPCTSAPSVGDTGETQDYFVEVTPAIEVTTGALAVAEVGLNYSQVITATGGVGTLTWSLHSGSLPDGLSLVNTGLIVGVPRANADAPTPYQFTLLVTDQATPQNATLATFNLTVQPFSGIPITIVSTSLPNGIINTSYSVQIQVVNGANPNQSPSPYNFSINPVGGGVLPTGLGMSAFGAIQGTPQTLGLYSFQVDVEDPAGFVASRTFSITVTNPAGGGGGGGGGGNGGGTVALTTGGNCTLVAAPAGQEIVVLVLLGLVLLVVGRVVMVRRRIRAQAALNPQLTHQPTDN